MLKWNQYRHPTRQLGDGIRQSRFLLRRDNDAPVFTDRPFVWIWKRAIPDLFLWIWGILLLMIYWVDLYLEYMWRFHHAIVGDVRTYYSSMKLFPKKKTPWESQNFSTQNQILIIWFGSLPFCFHGPLFKSASFQSRWKILVSIKPQKDFQKIGVHESYCLFLTTKRHNIIINYIYEDIIKWSSSHFFLRHFCFRHTGF